VEGEEVEEEEEEEAVVVVVSRQVAAQAGQGRSRPALRLKGQARIAEDPHRPLLYLLASSSQGG